MQDQQTELEESEKELSEEDLEQVTEWVRTCMFGPQHVAGLFL
jgi:hypothetical protein